MSARLRTSGARWIPLSSRLIMLCRAVPVQCPLVVSFGMDRQIEHRDLEINIVNLCVKLVAVARGYYKENKDKFNFFNYTLKDNREVYG